MRAAAEVAVEPGPQLSQRAFDSGANGLYWHAQLGGDLATTPGAVEVQKDRRAVRLAQRGDRGCDRALCVERFGDFRGRRRRCRRADRAFTAFASRPGAPVLARGVARDPRQPAPRCADGARVAGECRRVGVLR